MVFAVIVIVAIFLCWILGVYAVYTYREVEMAKLDQAAKEHDEDNHKG